MRTWKIAGINFDHMHMGDLLRQVHEHPRAEVCGICHREMSEGVKYVIEQLKIPPERFFTDYRECMEKTRPDAVILCPATSEHADWVENVAPYGVDLLVEKPFAATLAEADRMIAAVKKTGKRLAINWPLRWYPPHVTAKRLIDEGQIGEVREVHYYDGNRGPLRHGADKVEKVARSTSEKASAWWYRKNSGGGSLLDYLGYGVTLGTWYHGGAAPLDVTAVTWGSPDIEVDEHSITVCRYACGMSKYETRWGTFTDPWTLQPQPKCGFTIVGSRGTIGSYDYEKSIFVQTWDSPEGLFVANDELREPDHAPIAYFLHCLETGTPITGPLSPELCRIGQRIVDSAVLSAANGRTVALVDR